MFISHLLILIFFSICTQVLFIYLDIKVEENQRIMEFFGLKKEEAPTLRYIQMGEELMKYKPETTELTSKAVVKFVKDVQDGKIKVCMFLCAICL
jgi:protein disulfide-isomerase A1